ncbi:MAG TPA: hypothetical protein DC047_19790 [Blastocatellia bacterium]|nr:hypothetical protein [Blastocatellia bacterium]
MAESTRGQDDTNQSKTDVSNRKPDSDATSKETLSDVQENEKQSGSTADALDPGPSPDGAFDESDELKDAGPM